MVSGCIPAIEHEPTKTQADATADAATCSTTIPTCLFSCETQGGEAAKAKTGRTPIKRQLFRSASPAALTNNVPGGTLFVEQEQGALQLFCRPVVPARWKQCHVESDARAPAGGGTECRRIRNPGSHHK